MPTRLNPATGLFEDIPDSTDSPLTTIPDPAADNINAKDETVLEQPPVTLIPPITSIPDSPKVSNHKLTEKQQLYLEITDILREHQGLESNIPVNHDYWKKLNTYRSMR